MPYCCFEPLTQIQLLCLERLPSGLCLWQYNQIAFSRHVPAGWLAHSCNGTQIHQHFVNHLFWVVAPEQKQLDWKLLTFCDWLRQSGLLSVAAVKAERLRAFGIPFKPLTDVGLMTQSWVSRIWQRALRCQDQMHWDQAAHEAQVFAEQ